jgi:hypothetical protein
MNPTYRARIIMTPIRSSAMILRRIEHLYSFVSIIPINSSIFALFMASISSLHGFGAKFGFLSSHQARNIPVDSILLVLAAFNRVRDIFCMWSTNFCLDGKMTEKGSIGHRLGCVGMIDEGKEKRGKGFSLRRR